MSEIYLSEGKHVVCDLFGVDPELLVDEVFALNAMITAAKKCGATVLKHTLHKFEGEGSYTILVMLAESHISAHSYCEHGAIMFDAYVCGKADPLVAIGYLTEKFNPTKVNMRVFTRGTEQIEEIK
jgi:S-adenosylmethionine decarboxylase